MPTPGMTGPCLLLVNPSTPIDEKSLRRIVDTARDSEYYKVKENPGDREKGIRYVLTAPAGGLSSPVRWDWEPWTEISKYDPLTYIPASEMMMITRWSSNDPRFEWQAGQRTLMFYFNKRGSRGLHPFPDHQQHRVDYLLDVWKKILGVLQPEFALIDDYPYLHKKKGTDLRRTAWGVNVYGPNLAKAMERNLLDKAGFWRIERLPWAGVWAQLTQNPFNVPMEKRRQAERTLTLARTFAEATKSA